MLAAIGPDLPGVLHGDMAGIISDVGNGVDNFKVGDEVYGCIGGFKGMPGVLSEFALADTKLLARKPRNISMAEAASLPLVGITSWNALIDRGNIKLTKEFWFMQVRRRSWSICHTIGQSHGCRDSLHYPIIGKES